MALKAHVGFSIPNTKEIGPRIVSHFSGLGYRLMEQQPHKWMFQRGNKLSALWRFDIRAYHTILTVLSADQQEDSIWVSCDWEVYTFLNITTGGDIGTLEAEERQLESVIRTSA